MDSSSSTTARHAWPKNAPPKLRCGAPSQCQKKQLVCSRESGVPYNDPRHETSSHGLNKNKQVWGLPRHSLNKEFPTLPGNITKFTSPRTSLPTTVPSSATRCNRRAVLIAATYFGTKGISHHSESINHVSNLFRLLTVTLNFRKDNVWVLTDAPEKVVGCSVKLGATRRNILTSLKWLVTGSKSEDILFFGFSGLGGTVTKHVRDKESFSEDCLLPSDYPVSSPIPESELSFLFATELHANASLTALLDSRDASKVLRLPYIQSAQSTSRSKYVVQETLEGDQTYSEREKHIGLAGRLLYNRVNEEYNEMRRKIAAEERDLLASAFSGCGQVVAFGFAGLSEQQHKIPRVKPIPVGALTEAFVNCLSQGIAKEKEFTYRSVLLNIVRTVASKRNSQLPQISSSHRLDICSTLPLFRKTGSAHI